MNIRQIGLASGLTRKTVYKILGENMSETMWALEFSYGRGTIGGAQDVIRQATPAGEAMPTVNQAGTLGFEVVAGKETVDRLRGALEERRETCQVRRRVGFY